MKHISDYTRTEIIRCLRIAGLTQVNGKNIKVISTEKLRIYLNDAVVAGDAPELEQIPNAKE